jgi:hypothetical protein
VDDENSNKGYYGFDEQAEDKDVALLNVLNALAASIGKPKKDTPRETRIVDFKEFKGGNQDPIEWLNIFEQAFRANNVRTNDRKIVIAASFMRGEALTWFNSENIQVWNEKLLPGQSFVPKFKEQYCGTFKKVQWKQQLNDLTQKNGETIDSYYAKLVNLWIRIDPTNSRLEEDRIHEFIKGLRPEFQMPVQIATPITVDQAVAKAKAVETTLSRGGNLSDYSKKKDYLYVTKGGTIPSRYNVNKTETQEDEIEAIITKRVEEKLKEYRNKKDGKMKCYNCGKEGHISKNCNKKKEVCTKCNKEGHNKDKCRSHLKCNKCGKHGHLAKTCRVSNPSSKSNSRNNSPERNSNKDKQQRHNNASYENISSDEEEDELEQDLNE